MYFKDFILQFYKYMKIIHTLLTLPKCNHEPNRINYKVYFCIRITGHISISFKFVFMTKNPLYDFKSSLSYALYSFNSCSSRLNFKLLVTFVKKQVINIVVAQYVRVTYLFIINGIF